MTKPLTRKDRTARALGIACENCHHAMTRCQCETTKPRLFGPDARTRADMRRACQERS
jgi:hypothetical protein